jgi:uncharacterized protein (TIGR02678 family)
MIGGSETFETNPEVEAEQRRALRALLRQPLLTAEGATSQEYILARRHAEWLKHWFIKFPAWSLHIDQDVIRLRKIPADFLDDTRPAIDRASGTPFSKRRYALLCLALAVLEQSDRQTTLGQIAKGIMELVAADRDLQMAGLVFDIGNYDQRRDLMHAIRYLIDTGILRRLDGDERQFLNRNDSSDVLYDINRPILATMLNVSKSASAVETAEEGSNDNSITERIVKLIDDPITVTEDSRSQQIRLRLVRALLDDPILYFDDLNAEERIYLAEHRRYLLRQIHEATGLIAEVRREGIAMVDDAGDLTDLKLPEEDTDGQLSLLLLQWLFEIFSESAVAEIPISEIEEHVCSLAQVHETGAAARSTQDALSRLHGLRLIRFTPGGVVPLAGAGRYASRNSGDEE